MAYVIVHETAQGSGFVGRGGKFGDFLLRRVREEKTNWDEI